MKNIKAVFFATMLILILLCGCTTTTGSSLTEKEIVLNPGRMIYAPEYDEYTLLPLSLSGTDEAGENRLIDFNSIAENYIDRKTIKAYINIYDTSKSVVEHTVIEFEEHLINTVFFEDNGDFILASLKDRFIDNPTYQVVRYDMDLDMAWSVTTKEYVSVFFNWGDEVAALAPHEDGSGYTIYTISPEGELTGEYERKNTNIPDKIIPSKEKRVAIFCYETLSSYIEFVSDFSFPDTIQTVHFDGQYFISKTACSIGDTYTVVGMYSLTEGDKICIIDSQTGERLHDYEPIDIGGRERPEHAGLSKVFSDDEHFFLFVEVYESFAGRAEQLIIEKLDMNGIKVEIQRLVFDANIRSVRVIEREETFELFCTTKDSDYISYVLDGIK